MATFCAFHSHLNNPTFPPGQVGASDQDLQCPQAPNSWNRGSAPAGCVTLGRQPKLSGLLPLNPIPSLTRTVLNHVLLWEDSSVVDVLKYLSPCWSDHVTGRLSVKTVPPSPFVWLVLERSKTCHQTLSGPWEQFPGTPSCAPFRCSSPSRRTFSVSGWEQEGSLLCTLPPSQGRMGRGRLAAPSVAHAPPRFPEY